MARDSFQGVTEQAKASRHRRQDAQILHDGGRWRGSMYVAGYAIECLLKAKLMKQYGCFRLQDLEDELRRRGLMSERATVYTHELERLLAWTQSMGRLQQNIRLWRTFNLVNRWLPAWRYDADVSNRDDSHAFLEAVDTILQWIQSNV